MVMQSPFWSLKAADFTVFGNGVRRQIAHFSTQAYFEGVPPAQTPRTFFFLLGRGRLNETTKALDALLSRPPGAHHAVSRVEFVPQNSASSRHVKTFNARNEAQRISRWQP